MATIASPPKAKGGQYQIQSGDTLWDIAKAVYGDPLRWKEIAKANGIENANRIKPGQTIVLPGTEPTPTPRANPKRGVPVPRSKPPTIAERPSQMGPTDAVPPLPPPSTGAERPLGKPNRGDLTADMLAEGPTDPEMAAADAMDYDEWMAKGRHRVPDTGMPAAKVTPEIASGESFANRQRSQAINMEMIANGGVLKPRRNPARMGAKKPNPLSTLLQALMSQ